MDKLIDVLCNLCNHRCIRSEVRYCDALKIAKTQVRKVVMEEVVGMLPEENIDDAPNKSYELGWADAVSEMRKRLKEEKP